jgi:membrane protease YdiL (CAAX protease family)
LRGDDFGRDGPFVGPGSRFARGTVISYVVLLVGAEVTALEFSIRVSLACYAALLIVILTHLVLFPARPEIQAALASLALVPLLKVGAIALPQQLVPDAYWEAFPAVLALATVFALRGVVAGAPIGAHRSTGLAGWATQVVIAATGPAFAIGAGYVLSGVHPATPDPTLTHTQGSVLGVAAFSGCTLEIVFRGYVQFALIRLFGRSGIAIASLLYAGLFLGSGSGFIILLGLVTGLVWGLAAAGTRTVSGVATGHALFALSWAALY